MKYKVIYEQDFSSLHDEVDELIKVGFEPLGGICANNDSDGEEWFYQAMTKRDKEPEYCDVSGAKLRSAGGKSTIQETLTVEPTAEQSSLVEPKTLVLEVGKIYKDRIGDKWFVFFDDGYSRYDNYCMHALRVGYPYCTEQYTRGGMYRNDGSVGGLDLIEEWKD